MISIFVFYTQVYNHKIQVKFEFGYNPPINMGDMAPFWFYRHCFVRTLEFHIHSITRLPFGFFLMTPHSYGGQVSAIYNNKKDNSHLYDS